MSSVDQMTQPLVAGEKLSRDEFLRRWELLPSVKRAELIGGVVYMPSPVSLGHRSHHGDIVGLLFRYAVFTPGCDAGADGTWLMLEDAAQPDADLRILPEYGGQSSVEGSYGSRAPELVAEISLSSKSYDLGPKLDLYRTAGVREYIVVLVEESKVIWRGMTGDVESFIQPDRNGILRSLAFPGLWLDAEALLKKDLPRMLRVLNKGLRSPEHEQFVEDLARKV
ncbi:MAG: Uma2 family endonuclease [Acidobacteriota bacterium]|nr:Uma2 family endonuclease [Acidobacteriota bacterium]